MNSSREPAVAEGMLPDTMRPLEQQLAEAIALYNAGQQPQARARCEQMLAAGARHPALHQLMAVLELDAGDPQAALQHAQRSLRARPHHPPTLKLGAQAWFALSLRAHARGDREGERDALEHSLALCPEHVEAAVNLGIWLQAQGRLDDAMRCYGRAYRLREATFGRIANALCSEPRGALWLDLNALRAALAAAAG